MNIPLPAAQKLPANTFDAGWAISLKPEQGISYRFLRRRPAPTARRRRPLSCSALREPSASTSQSKCRALSPFGTPAALRSAFVAPQAIGFLGPTPKPRLVLLRSFASPSGSASLCRWSCSACFEALWRLCYAPAPPVFSPAPQALAVSLRSSGSRHASPAAPRLSPLARCGAACVVSLRPSEPCRLTRTFASLGGGLLG